MVNYRYQVSVEHNIYPNITVYDRLKDEQPAGWHIKANEGYMFYDINTEDYVDEETGEVFPKPFLSEAFLPSSYDFNNFPYIAILRTETIQ